MGRPIRARLVPVVLLLIALVVPTTGVVAAPAYQQIPTFKTVIVGLKPGVTNPGAVADDLGRKHGGQQGYVYLHAFKGFTLTLPEQVIPLLQRDPRIAFVEVDQMVQAVELPTGADRIEADVYHDTQSSGSPESYSVPVDVAILDTGIAPHSDLNVVGSVDCTYTSWFGRASCRTGANSDENGHGTHVAGTVAGKANGGSPGVAPGARLWQVRVLGSNGSGTMSGIVAGIDWVTARASTISVINLSLGCECSSTALTTALSNATNAGIVVVAAAGNNGKDASTFTPANHPRVIAVSAMSDYDGKHGGLGSPTCRTGTDDGFASFSNFGNSVTLAAPGVCIRSTWPGGGYNTISGTSMASPHVAGAAALYIAENSVPRNSSRWSTVMSGLQSDAWSVPQNHACGFAGGISGERLLMLSDCTAETGDPSPPPVNVEPEVSISSPAANASVDGSVEIQVAASDDLDPAGSLDVDVRIDGGAWQNTSYSGGVYRYSWDTLGLENGPHTIEARATDSGPLTSSTAPIGVTVNNVLVPSNTEPSAEIVAPGNGETVHGVVTIGVNASDNEDLAGTLNVQVRINSGEWQNAAYDAGTYEWDWDTSDLVNADYLISARVTDSGGLQASATGIQLSVNNPLPPVAESMHVASLTGSSQRVSFFSWRANVTIRVVDSDGFNVANATVHGTWSTGNTITCSTGSTGTCSTSLSGISVFTSSVSFQVTSLSHASLSYVAGDNMVTSIMVTR